MIIGDYSSDENSPQRMSARESVKVAREKFERLSTNKEEAKDFNKNKRAKNIFASDPPTLSKKYTEDNTKPRSSKLSQLMATK